MLSVFDFLDPSTRLVLENINALEAKMSDLTDKVDAALTALSSHEADDKAKVEAATAAAALLQSQVDGLTQGNKVHNYQLSNATTWVKNAHTVKFGFEARQSRFFVDGDNSPRGSFTFNGSYSSASDSVTGNPVARTGDPVADFLL